MRVELIHFEPPTSHGVALSTQALYVLLSLPFSHCVTFSAPPPIGRFAIQSSQVYQTSLCCELNPYVDFAKSRTRPVYRPPPGSPCW